MIWFVFGIIFAVAALLWLTIGSKKLLKFPGYVMIAIAVLCIIASFVAVVGTRNVGVPTTFGKPTGDTYSNGLHIKPPWENVTDVDATIHPVEYFGEKAIDVKIADGGEAKVSLAYRWRINPVHADKVFADYRNSDESIDDAVKHALVSTNIKAAINEELGTYNPLDGTDISSDMTPEELSNLKVNVIPDYEALNKAIQVNVESKIKATGDLVEVQSVTISNVKLPDATQKRINAFNQAVQNTKIALQDVATKTAQAEGNLALGASLRDPNVLVSQCFDALEAGDFVAPAGFSCWPGSDGSVVIPAAK